MWKINTFQKELSRSDQRSNRTGNLTRLTATGVSDQTLCPHIAHANAGSSWTLQVQGWNLGVLSPTKWSVAFYWGCRHRLPMQQISCVLLAVQINDSVKYS
jgi:hypothetical protein